LPLLRGYILRWMRWQSPAFMILIDKIDVNSFTVKIYLSSIFLSRLFSVGVLSFVTAFFLYLWNRSLEPIFGTDLWNRVYSLCTACVQLACTHILTEEQIYTCCVQVYSLLFAAHTHTRLAIPKTEYEKVGCTPVHTKK
jgi:hypothetical protein